MSFVSIPDSGSYLYYGEGTTAVDYDGVVFSTSAEFGNSRLFNVGSGWTLGAPVLSSQFADGVTGTANILITFPESVTAFAVNYGTSWGEPVTFTLSNGHTMTYVNDATYGYGVPYFLGITDSPFTSVLMTAPDAILNINNVASADATATGTPEPAACLLLATGLVGLLAYRRRRA